MPRGVKQGREKGKKKKEGLDQLSDSFLYYVIENDQLYLSLVKILAFQSLMRFKPLNFVSDLPRCLDFAEQFFFSPAVHYFITKVIIENLIKSQSARK